MSRRSGRRYGARGSSSSSEAPLFDPLELSDLTVLVRGDVGLVPATFAWQNDGSAGDFTQASASLKPAAGTIAGVAACDFDGSDDACATGLASTVIALDEWWCSGVIEIDALTATSATPAYTAHPIFGDNGAYFGIFAWLSSGQPRLVASHSDGAVQRTSGDGVIALSTPQYFEGGYSGGSLRIRCNGGAEVAAAWGAMPAAGLNAAVALGKATFSAAFNGRIGELAITTAVPDASNLAAWRNRQARIFGVTTP